MFATVFYGRIDAGRTAATSFISRVFLSVPVIEYRAEKSHGAWSVQIPDPCLLGKLTDKKAVSFYGVKAFAGEPARAVRPGALLASVARFV